MFWKQKAQVRNHFRVFSRERLITGKPEGIALQVITTVQTDITARRCCCVARRVAGEEAMRVARPRGSLGDLAIYRASKLLM